MVKTDLHQSIDIICRTTFLGQCIVSPDKLVQVVHGGDVQDGQVVHVRISEQIHDAFQRSYLPVDGVVESFH